LTVEQEPIDISRATPASPSGEPRARHVHRGIPLWLQIVLSVVVILAVGWAWITFFPGADATLARFGISLPGASAQPAADAAARPGGVSGRAGPGGAGGFAGRGAFNREAVVVTKPVVVATINNKLTAIGEGVAAQSVTVTSASGGTLVALHVKPGDHVEAGAKLAELDSSSQQNAYDRARLASQDADATLARTQELAKSNSVSASQVSAAQLAADTARLQLENAGIDLADRTITTPVAGTVGIIQVTPGNLVNAQTVVTTIEDTSSILINFWVPERYSSQMAVGMDVEATSAALPGQTFEGKITAVDNRIDPDSRTLQVQATLPNSDGRIRPGMSFSVTLSFPGETFPAVDPLSLQWSSDGAYVWKMVDGKVHKAMVDIIQRNTDGVLVKGEVAEGDQVVTQGVLQLQEGAAVRLLDAPSGQQAADAASSRPAAPAALAAQ
jgi:RND family efflux transporter MFP subunit